MYAIIAAAVWLGWEVAKVPLISRAPPAIAVRLAPRSPEVLRRASEAELTSKRVDNALALADASLSHAPFNARALRVVGLSVAASGDSARANELLTLAGNWSLRDDPAHAWLVDYRLRQGDYVSAFAHADTLARRRTDLYPSVFSLFTSAAVADPRAVPVLSNLIAANPPWRGAYLNQLYAQKDKAPTLAALVITLERTRNPLTMQELQHLYALWLADRRFSSVRALREQVGRPPLSQLLQNGDFSVPIDRQFYPFAWQLGAAAGIGVSVTEDDLRGSNASLRVEYDGFGNGLFAEQVLLLPPGSYILHGEARGEGSVDNTRMKWLIACADDNSEIVRSRPTSSAKWRRFELPFTVPATNCTVQRLLLLAEPGERRTTIVEWFDNLGIGPVSKVQG